jgi:hypothetical protein
MNCPNQDQPQIRAVEMLIRDLECAMARPQSRHLSARNPRRLVVVAAILAALAVPGAFGAKSLLAPTFPHEKGTPAALDQVPTTKPVFIGSGQGHGGEWRISAYESDGGLCVHIHPPPGPQSPNGFGGSCSPDLRAGAKLSVSGTLGDVHGQGYVFGAVTKAIDTVEVSSGRGDSVRAAAQNPDPDALKLSGLPDDFRYFVAILPHPLDGSQPVTVLAISDGHVVARTQI